MLLIVDKSEESSNPKFVQMLKKNFAQVIVTNLPHRIHGNTKVTAGDINIPLDDGNLLAIERKTPEDFLASISHRRIFNQVEVMANNAKYSAVVITGKISYGGKHDMTYINDEVTEWSGASVRAVIRAIQYSGCVVDFCPQDQFCNQITEIYKLVNKPDKHQSIVKNRIITFPPIDERVEFIAQMPGVGLKLADSLLIFAGKMENNADELGYGSVAAALHWVTLLSQIDKAERPAGWGAAKILTIRKFFGLASDEYFATVKELGNQIVVISGQEYGEVPF